MSTEKTEAIVIRQADFSETSRVVTLFTREFGKISTVAKGARRLKGPFEGALDLLAVCRIVFIRKSSSSLDILTEAQLIKRFTPNQQDLTSLYGAYFVAELLTSLTEEYDPHPILFDEAVDTLSRLAEEPDTKLPIARFELVVLREIGQLPNFEECIACGQLLTESQAVSFWVSQGGLLCPACQKEEFSHNRIQAGTAAVLRRLSTESDHVGNRLSVSPGQLQEIQRICMTAITHALGRRPKMYRYLKS